MRNAIVRSNLHLVAKLMSLLFHTQFLLISAVQPCAVSPFLYGPHSRLWSSCDPRNSCMHSISSPWWLWHFHCLIFLMIGEEAKFWAALVPAWSCNCTCYLYWKGKGDKPAPLLWGQALCCVRTGFLLPEGILISSDAGSWPGGTLCTLEWNLEFRQS